MEKIFIVLNEDYFLLTHRKELAVRAQEAGYDMAIVAGKIPGVRTGGSVGFEDAGTTPISSYGEESDKGAKRLFGFSIDFISGRNRISCTM